MEGKEERTGAERVSSINLLTSSEIVIMSVCRLAGYFTAFKLVALRPPPHGPLLTDSVRRSRTPRLPLQPVLRDDDGTIDDGCRATKENLFSVSHAIDDCERPASPSSAFHSSLPLFSSRLPRGRLISQLPSCAKFGLDLRRQRIRQMMEKVGKGRPSTTAIVSIMNVEQMDDQ